VGSIDGFGSVIVNGVRFDNSSAVYDLEEFNTLAIGHVVRIDGSFDAAGSSGKAVTIHSAPEIQGPVSTVNKAASTFVVLGQEVSISAATVFDGLASVADLAPGDAVRISGLPFQSGQLQASRISKLSAVPATAYVTGQVTSADSTGKTFMVGAQRVSYTASTTMEGAASTTLKVGAYVRVNGTLVGGNVVSAARIRPWQAQAANTVAVTWAGVVSDYVSTASFTIGGQPVDASTAQITGGPASSIGNGVRVEIDGVMTGGVLKASKLRIRHVPGTGGPASFSVNGAIGAFSSSASFRVQGQPVNASAPDVVFVNGTAAKLGNGKKVSITGSKVVDGVLIANLVVFE
jgi:hypothetical protein